MRSAIAVALLLITAIVAFEAFFLVKKFPRYVPSPWIGQPVDLARVARLRIGIVRGRHGAEFVRLPKNQPALSQLDDADFQEVESEMRQQLRSIPLKAGFEIIWYFVILFGIVYFPIARTLGRDVSNTRLIFTCGVAVFAAIFLLQVPLFFGYDTSIFSTWYGPGAYSWSRPQPALTGALGIAVSYRFVLEAVTAPAVNVAIRMLDFFDRAYDTPAWVFHILVSFVYAVVGVFFGIVLSALRAALASRDAV